MDGGWGEVEMTVTGERVGDLRGGASHPLEEEPVALKGRA